MTKKLNLKKLSFRALTIALIAILIFTLISCNKDDKNTSFFHSDGLDENGFWIGINAKSLVELFDYKAFSIPEDVHKISEQDLEEAIDDILSHYTGEKIEIYDRAIEDGDLVCISYIGSVDGVEFEGGSTGEDGTEVTAGSDKYIDDFLTQIIGHTPGETMNVEVTFPEDYGKEDLNGKDALFVTTIKYIIEILDVELTDEFVAENMYVDYGYEWTTVDELKAGLTLNLQKSAIEEYVQDYMINKVTVKSIPKKLSKYYEDSMLDYYQYYADLYEMEFEEFLVSYVGVSSKADLIADNVESNEQQARYYLVCQAIAEDANIAITEDDLVEYLGSDYLDYEEEYGLPYLKQYSLGMKVLDFIVENSVLA